MGDQFDILLGGKGIGQAVVTRQGLYYQFTCRCRISGEVMYKLEVSCGENTENLGLLVPDGDEFVLTARVPIKQLGQGKLSFRAVPRHGEIPKGKFVPVYPDEPFAYISQLKNAFLEKRDGQLGVVLREI